MDHVLVILPCLRAAATPYSDSNPLTWLAAGTGFWHWRPPAARRCRPHQLHHNAATRIRKEFGLEVAQILLGHSKADVTQVYAERDVSRAAAVAAKIG